MSEKTGIPNRKMSRSSTGISLEPVIVFLKKSLLKKGLENKPWLPFRFCFPEKKLVKKIFQGSAESRKITTVVFRRQGNGFYETGKDKERGNNKVSFLKAALVQKSPPKRTRSCLLVPKLRKAV